MNIDWSKVTLKEVVNKRTYQKYSRIRDLSRRFFFTLNRPNKCEICSYDKHIEVCHIKPIHAYDESATVTEINNESNLVGLCCNCHWELDNGLLKL